MLFKPSPEVIDFSAQIHYTNSKYDKTKEFLAFLASKRGALCSNDQVICTIFEDDGDHESYLRGLRKDLVDSFTALGLKDTIQVQRGKMGIITEGISCDFYDYLKVDPGAINSYRGEFIYQYSRAEYMNMDLL